MLFIWDQFHMDHPSYYSIYNQFESYIIADTYPKGQSIKISLSESLQSALNHHKTTMVFKHIVELEETINI